MCTTREATRIRQLYSWMDFTFAWHPLMLKVKNILWLSIFRCTSNKSGLLSDIPPLADGQSGDICQSEEGTITWWKQLKHTDTPTQVHTQANILVSKYLKICMKILSRTIACGPTYLFLVCQFHFCISVLGSCNTLYLLTILQPRP